jgi:hypothetical protein
MEFVDDEVDEEEDEEGVDEFEEGGEVPVPLLFELGMVSELRFVIRDSGLARL